MQQPRLPKWFLDQLKSITAKRPRAVIEHILKHGHVTTEELAAKYGYRHPPRGARDVREQGIPLETFFLKDSRGRRMAAYKFADVSEVRNEFLGGRRQFTKEFKDLLYKDHGGRCAICLQPFEKRYLQVDHRVPYEVAGETLTGGRRTLEYLLLCGSCNRAKSWSCEHCSNWQSQKSVFVCQTCYWASPEGYTHVAMVEMRRVEVVWTADEISHYEKLKAEAAVARLPLPEYVRTLLKAPRHKQSEPVR